MILKIRKNLTLISISLALLLATALAYIGMQDVHAQNGYVEGQSPIIITQAGADSYGGMTGRLNSGILDQNGNITYQVLFPSGGPQIESNGQPELLNPPKNGVAGFPGAWQGCQMTSDGELCTIKINFSNYWSGLSPQYRDTGVWTAQVLNATDTSGSTNVYGYALDGSINKDGMEFRVDGPVAGPIGLFENQSTQTITDPNVQSHQISVLVRDPAGVNRVELDVGGESVTLTNGVLVPQSSTVGSNTYRFTYDWNVGPLDTGLYEITGKAFSNDGRSATILTSANNSKVFVTLAVEVTEKLREQCEENKSAVEGLIDSINGDANERTETINNYSDAIFEYIQSQEEISEEVQAAIDTVAESRELVNSSLTALDSYAELSCDISLATTVNVYKTTFDSWVSELKTYSENLVNLINTYLGE